MLSKLIIFSFCFLGLFALIFSTMPSQFLTNQAVWNPSYYRTDEQVCSFFNANNITVYSNQAAGNLTPGNYYVVPWGSGKQLSLVWAYNILEGFLIVPAPLNLHISYETQHWFLGVFEYWTSENLRFRNIGGVDRGVYIVKSELLEDETQSVNGTTYDARSNSGVHASVFYTGNGTTDLETSWDVGQLTFMLSYELNATASGMNMFSLLTQILTFQAPQLGVSGIFGDFLNALIAIPIYAVSGYIVYKLIAGIAPWLSGGSGD